MRAGSGLPEILRQEFNVSTAGRAEHFQIARLGVLPIAHPLVYQQAAATDQQNAKNGRRQDVGRGGRMKPSPRRANLRNGKTFNPKLRERSLQLPIPDAENTKMPFRETASIWPVTMFAQEQSMAKWRGNMLPRRLGELVAGLKTLVSLLRFRHQPLFSGFVFVLVVFTESTLMAAANITAYVSGECDMIQYDYADQPVDTKHGHFKISTDGCLSRVWIQIEGDPVDYREVTTDGTNTYYLTFLSKVIEEMKSRGVNVGENVASGTVLKRPVPNLESYSPAGVIWLAFGSYCYFHSVSANGSAQSSVFSGSIHIASGTGTAGGNDVEQFNVLRDATWEFDHSGLLVRVVYFEPPTRSPAVPPKYQKGFTNSIYQVLLVTNIAGTQHPLVAECDTFWFKPERQSGNELWKRFTTRVWVKEIKQELPALFSIEMPPILPGKTLVSEGRFVEDTGSPKKSWSYFSEGRFPSEDKVKQTPDYLRAPPPINRIVALQGGEAKSRRFPFFFIIFISAALPLLLYFSSPSKNAPFSKWSE